MMKKYLRLTLFVLTFALVLTALWAGSVLAQGPTPTDDDVNAVAKQLYCPVCENTPLDVCPTEACRQWRELIRTQLSQGWSQDQIKQYFVENYGARVLGEPPASGLNWAFYILPPLIILAGAFVLFRALRSWTKASATEPTAGAPEAAQSSQDEYVSKFEEELRKRK
jgi:cytochrome c-type biogenesis protein CcmH